MSRRITGIVVAAVLCLCVSMPSAHAGRAKAPRTVRVSLGNGNVEGDSSASSPDGISDNGRFVAFGSDASNLNASDANGESDVFLRDRRRKTTTIMSHTSTGASGNGSSQDANISGNGRFTVYESAATNLIGTDANGTTQDIFVTDRNTGAVSLVSQATGGTQSNGPSFDPSISRTGRYVAFISFGTNLVSGDTNGTVDVFVRDLKIGTTTLVSSDSAGVLGNSFSLGPYISSNGKFVAFWSAATNLVTGDTNVAPDTFVKRLSTGATTRVSVTSNGAQADSGSADPSITRDGRFVVFESDATNLVAGDTNGTDDVFLHDAHTGKTTRISVSSSEAQATGGESEDPVIAANGRFVVYTSAASNLVNNDTSGAEDIFIRDRKLGRTSRISKSTNGTQANGDSFDPVVTANGRFVAFASEAMNLVPNDTNGADDVFVRVRKK